MITYIECFEKKNEETYPYTKLTKKENYLYTWALPKLYYKKVYSYKPSSIITDTKCAWFGWKKKKLCTHGDILLSWWKRWVFLHYSYSRDCFEENQKDLFPISPNVCEISIQFLLQKKRNINSLNLIHVKIVTGHIGVRGLLKDDSKFVMYRCRANLKDFEYFDFDSSTPYVERWQA